MDSFHLECFPSIKNFNSIEHLHLMQSQDFSNRGLAKMQLRGTQTSQFQMFLNGHRQECQYSQSEPVQISFENNFMDEHLETLNKKVKILMEVLVFKKNYPEQCIFQQKSMHLSFESFLTSSSFLINTAKAKEFERWLEKKEKLKEFLKLIYLSYPSEISHDLIRVSYQIWNRNVGTDLSLLQQEELLKVGMEIAGESLIMMVCQRLELFKSQGKTQLQMQQINRFLDYYIVTNLFVQERFFDNPFSNGKDHHLEKKTHESLSLSIMEQPSMMDFAEECEESQNQESLGNSKKKRKL